MGLVLVLGCVRSFLSPARTQFTAARGRLYLQTKLSNPHYKPEISAQCTLINFIVTEEVNARASP